MASTKVKTTLETLLAGLTIALSAVHNSGVKLGHFGSTDFIPVAESVSEVILSALVQPGSALAPEQPQPQPQPIAA